MNITRNRIARASSLAFIVASSMLGAGRAAATVPPTTPPATDSSTPATADTTPQIVESWTLTPSGTPNGDAPGNRPNLTYQLTPGAVVKDKVIVFNLGNVALDMKIYATDAFNNDSGAFDLLPAATPPVDAGSWVTFDLNELVLAPGKQAVIPITITVPLDATPGDHVGGILASNIVPSTNGGNQVVNVDRRTGTRLYIQVQGKLTPELAVPTVKTTYHQAVNSFGGSADVTFRVENRGNVRLAGTPTVEITGPLGIGSTTLKLPPFAELLPGQHVELTAKLTGVSASFVNTTTVKIAAADPAVIVPAAQTTTVAPPITVLVLLLVLILVVLAVRQRRRRRFVERKRAPSKSPAGTLSTVREPQHQ